MMVAAALATGAAACGEDDAQSATRQPKCDARSGPGTSRGRGRPRATSPGPRRRRRSRCARSCGRPAAGRRRAGRPARRTRRRRRSRCCGPPRRRSTSLSVRRGSLLCVCVVSAPPFRPDHVEEVTLVRTHGVRLDVISALRFRVIADVSQVEPRTTGMDDRRVRRSTARRLLFDLAEQASDQAGPAPVARRRAGAHVETAASTTGAVAGATLEVSLEARLDESAPSSAAGNACGRQDRPSSVLPCCGWSST
jgi:hypothetical protein